MKHLTHHYDEEIYESNLLRFYFRDMKIGVLDIETTGLNASRSKFILGGLYEPDGKTMHQFFAQRQAEEKAALTEFMKQVSALDMVVTYNGRHFDLPFMKKRMEALDIEGSLPYNLDLYLVLNGHSPIRKFVPNLKQKTVENYMGLWSTRADEISGAESVTLYNTYEKTGDEALEEKILLHNSDDVLQLTRLLRVISKSDFHRAMFHLGFPAEGLIVEKIRIDGNALMVSGTQHATRMDYMGFAFNDWPVEIRFDRKSSDFYMKFPVIRNAGLCVIDLDAAKLERSAFEIYPTCYDGFLTLEKHNDRNFMEINHFIKAFLSRFMQSIS